MERTESHWKSVHICPSCGAITNLADINLQEITTGVVACSRCEWSGRIEIQIIEENGFE